MSATVTGSVPAGGNRLVYDEYGDGERVVVLLHGLLMRRTMHSLLAAELARRGYRVLCLDLLGHGDSDRPADKRQYSIELYGRQVIALLDELGVESAVVGGTSLGANTALEVAVQAPRRVRGLLLDMPVLEDSQTFWAMVIGPTIALYTVGRPMLHALRFAATRVPRGNFLRDLVLDWLRPHPGPSRHVLLGLVYGRKAPTAQDRRTIAAPALVIAHRRDYSHAISDANELVDELPNAELVRAKSIVELRARPERLTEEIVRFPPHLLECHRTACGYANRVTLGTPVLRVRVIARTPLIRRCYRAHGARASKHEGDSWTLMSRRFTANRRSPNASAWLS